MEGSGATGRKSCYLFKEALFRNSLTQLCRSLLSSEVHLGEVLAVAHVVVELFITTITTYY